LTVWLPSLDFSFTPNYSSSFTNSFFFLLQASPRLSKRTTHDGVEEAAVAEEGKAQLVVLVAVAVVLVVEKAEVVHSLPRIL
jgi:hypothetical protein